jgi:hypothetical protein
VRDLVVLDEPQKPPYEYCRADNCGQSICVRESPLFSMVCKLKSKLEVADRVLGEVKVAKGS